MGLEIRLHGRGGQGGVSCAKIIAAAYARTGKSVQTFGDYAGERSGAPVRAYTRVSDEPITNRNKVYEPDHLLVLDPTLLGAEVVTGLRPGGSLLLNTPDPIESFDGRYDAYRLATVDATAIARKHGIGSRSVVIVNTTIAGAFARVMGLPLEALEGAYKHLGFLGNFPAAREAYEAVVVREPTAEEVAAGAAAAPATPPPPRPAVPSLTEHVESAPTGLATGSWRTQRPAYKEQLAPCNAWCPAGNDVIGFIRTLGQDDLEGAAALLAPSQPLASVCGRVCPAPCMEGCNRAELDGALNIRGLERWIGDRATTARANGAPASQPRSIAILGGGPAGLSAAYTLARAGHRPLILEGEGQLGGVLRTGIPTYRLPREVLDREIEAILALGVETRCNEFLDAAAIERLVADHDAVILAAGLQGLRKLDVPGAALGGVEQGIRFLHRLNMGGDATVSGHVVVLGGGNTAMDCARSALRSGAERVTVAYRRTRAEMPAIREEIDEAIQEGIEMLFRRQPLAFRGRERVDRIELAEVEMGEPDDSGRRRPLVTDRTSSIECDHVLLALGQWPDLTRLPVGWSLEDGRIEHDGAPINVFCAGDFSTGDGTVVHAIGDGRRAAARAMQALGEDVQIPVRPDRTTAVPATAIRFDYFASREPARDRHLPVAERVTSLVEGNLGLEDPHEAGRCFSCGHCTSCDTCLVFCPEGIIGRHGDLYDIDQGYCKGCGICVAECPRAGMEMIAE